MRVYSGRALGPASQVPGSITVVQNRTMDLQAFVGKLEDGRAIVSFRGTRPTKIQDWVTDLKVRERSRGAQEALGELPAALRR